MGRLVSVLPNPPSQPTPENMIEAVHRALGLGVTSMMLGRTWAESEPEPGVIHLPSQEELLPGPLHHYFSMHCPISIHSRAGIPADMADRPLDDPEFVRRFVAFIDALLERAGEGTEPFHLGVGNEVNTYLALHPDEREAFAALLGAVRRLLADKYPGGMLGTTIAFQRPFDDPTIAALRPHLDWVGLQWYAFAKNPLGPDNFHPGRGQAEQVLDAMEAAAGDLPILVTEFGVPTSPVLEGSEEYQAEVIREFATAMWGRPDRFRLLSYWYLQDLTPEYVDWWCSGFYSTLPLDLQKQEAFREYIRTVGLLRDDGTPKLGAGILRELIASGGGQLVTPGDLTVG